MSDKLSDDELRFILHHYPYAVKYILACDKKDLSEKELFQRMQHNRETIYCNLADLPTIEKQRPVGVVLPREDFRRQYFLADFKNYEYITASWPRNKDNIPYRYLFDYVPVSHGSATAEEQNHRELIWNFKYDISKVDGLKHYKSLTYVVDCYSKLLKEEFGDLLSDITFVCVPTSSAESYNLRFREFAARLCKATGMFNAFDYIRIAGTRTPKHLNGNNNKCKIYIDTDWFKFRFVLYFDDVITTGSSLSEFANTLTQYGAFTIGALFIGQTIKH